MADPQGSKKYSGLPRNEPIGSYPGANAAAKTPAAVRTIVIDAGHGVSGALHDHGGIAPNGMQEADLNLGVSRALQAKLKERGYNVVMTRDQQMISGKIDYNKDADRPRSAVGWRAQVDPKADLFVSVHHDILWDDRDPKNLKPVSRPQPPQIYSYDGTGQSGALASTLASAVNGKAMKNDFAVLKPWLHQPTQSRDRPAVLAEMGNMNSPEDLKRATDPKAIDAVVTKLANALDNFMKTPEAKNGFQISDDETKRRAAGRKTDLAKRNLPDRNGNAATKATEPPATLAGTFPPAKEVAQEAQLPGKQTAAADTTSPAGSPAQAKSEGWVAWGLRKLGF